MTNQPPKITINGQPLPPEAIEFELGRLVKFYSQHMPEEPADERRHPFEEVNRGLTVLGLHDHGIGDDGR